MRANAVATRLPARAVIALDRAFGSRRMRKLSDQDGFRFMLDTRGKADIVGFALRVLHIAVGETPREKKREGAV